MLQPLENEHFLELPNTPFTESLETKYYLVSDLGRIYSKKLCRIISSNCIDNIARVSIKNKYKSGHRSINVAILVLLTFSPRNDFLGAMTPQLYAYHLDHDTTNNKLDNLIWSDGTKFGKKVMTMPILINLNCEAIPNEIWLAMPHISLFSNIINYKYLVSNYGRVYSLFNNTLLTLQDYDGYYRVSIKRTNGTDLFIFVHRLVMLTFNYVDNYDELQVNHLDGNGYNNYIGNLEWVTCRENIVHSYATGLSNNHFGDFNKASKISTDTVLLALKLYFDDLLSKQEISAITKISVSGCNDIFIGNSRIPDLFTYIQSKGYDKPFNMLTTDEASLIIENSTLDKFEFNSFLLNSLNINNRSLKYPLACIIRNSMLDKESWQYKKFSTEFIH